MASKKAVQQIIREEVSKKFDGCCALCGLPLGDRWHVWDIEPKQFVVTEKGQMIEGNDTFDNKLPSCIACNTTRIHHSGNNGDKINIEQFRQVLYHEFDFMKNHSMTATYYRKAIKFGLITETGNHIVFHFEKLGIII